MILLYSYIIRFLIWFPYNSDVITDMVQELIDGLGEEYEEVLLMAKAKPTGKPASKPTRKPAAPKKKNEKEKEPESKN